MAYINCRKCNAKALAGATRCPRCEASFLEDIATRGSRAATRRNCTRCGEEQMSVHELCAACRNQDRAVGQHRRTMVMRGAAVAVASVALVIAVLVPSSSDSPSVAQLPAPVVSPPTQVAASPAPPPATDSQAARAGAPSPTAIAQQPAPVPSQATAPTPVLAMANAAPVPPTDGEIHWVEAFASRSFYLRAAPDMNADIARVINAEELVLLGPTVAGWRRVRVGAMDGWAGASFFP